MQKYEAHREALLVWGGVGTVAVENSLAPCQPVAPLAPQRLSQAS
jgi:hypothetical protein